MLLRWSWWLNWNESWSSVNFDICTEPRTGEDLHPGTNWNGTSLATIYDDHNGSRRALWGDRWNVAFMSGNISSIIHEREGTAVLPSRNRFFNSSLIKVCATPQRRPFFSRAWAPPNSKQEPEKPWTDSFVLGRDRSTTPGRYRRVESINDASSGLWQRIKLVPEGARKWVWLVVQLSVLQVYGLIEQ